MVRLVQVPIPRWLARVAVVVVNISRRIQQHPLLANRGSTVTRTTRR